MTLRWAQQVGRACELHVAHGILDTLAYRGDRNRHEREMVRAMAKLSVALRRNR